MLEMEFRVSNCRTRDSSFRRKGKGATPTELGFLKTAVNLPVGEVPLVTSSG